jgi:hypothetical protein
MVRSPILRIFKLIQCSGVNQVKIVFSKKEYSILEAIFYGVTSADKPKKNSLPKPLFCLLVKVREKTKIHCFSFKNTGFTPLFISNPWSNVRIVMKEKGA